MKIPSLKLIKKIVYIATALVVVSQPAAMALTQDDINSILGGTAYYDPNASGSESCSVSSAGPGGTTSTGQVDLTGIAQTYGLQSAEVKQLGGSVIGSYNADQPPTTPASTMKLIIADTALRGGLDLSTVVSVGSDVYYDGSNDLGVNQISLSDAMTQMLGQSSNVAANVLMKAMGGVDAFTQKAQDYGYTHTTVKGYYDPANDDENTSTISDEVAAMDHIFSSQGAGYTTAQTALEGAAQNDNQYGVVDDANKWAGTTQVAGNVGKFSIGGQDYIIGLYTNSSDSNPAAISAIRDGSAAIATAVTNSLSSGSTISTTTVLVGNDNEQQVWNYFKSKGLGDAQVAGIMGNLQQESGFDPQKLEGGGDSQNPADAGSSGWGLIQWTPGTKVLQEASDNNISGPIYELSTQLDLIWAMMNGTSPVSIQDMVSGLSQQTDAASAATFFDNNFEGGKDPGGTGPGPTDAGPGGIREQNAASILQQYGGTGASGGTCGSTSADCSSATGNAKILCAAQPYAGIYYEYGGGHQGYSAFVAACPDPSNPPDNQPNGGPINGDPTNQSGNPSPCATDCSALVSIAVDAAFGQNFNWSVGTLESDTTNWQHIDLPSVQPGDVVVLDTDHIEIVDHYNASSGVLYTFGSHSTGTQTGEIQSTLSAWTGAYRYGSGSTD